MAFPDPTQPNEGATMQTPFTQAQNRLRSYVLATPPQTLGLLGTCLALCILDFFTFDIVSQGLTLERASEHKPNPGGLLTLVTLMIVSPFSPAHGLFSILISIYFGRDVFGERERLSRSAAYFFVGLGARQFFINGFALAIDRLWMLQFPSAWARIAIEGGFSGLLALVCALEAETASSDPFAQAELPMLPFTLSKRVKPFALAFLFSILGCGDIDLFCGATLGFIIGGASNMQLPSSFSFRLPQFTSNATATTEESSSLLPPRTEPPSLGTSFSHDTVNEQDRRALLLAAAERRLAETRGTSTSDKA